MLLRSSMKTSPKGTYSMCCTISMITVDITGKHKNLVSPISFIQDGVILFWNLDKRFSVSHCVYYFCFRLQKYSFFSKYRLLNPKIIIKSENNLSNWNSH